MGSKLSYLLTELVEQFTSWSFCGDGMSGLEAGFVTNARTLRWTLCITPLHGEVLVGGDFSKHSTRWWTPQSHKWWSHNRGCVLDEFASELAGDEDLIEKRKRRSSRMDMRDFVTFAQRETLGRAHTKMKDVSKSSRTRTRNRGKQTRLSKSSC